MSNGERNCGDCADQNSRGKRLKLPRIVDIRSDDCGKEAARQASKKCHFGTEWHAWQHRVQETIVAWRVGFRHAGLSIFA